MRPSRRLGHRRPHAGLGSATGRLASGLAVLLCTRPTTALLYSMLALSSLALYALRLLCLLGGGSVLLSLECASRTWVPQRSVLPFACCSCSICGVGADGEVPPKRALLTMDRWT